MQIHLSNITYYFHRLGEYNKTSYKLNTVWNIVINALIHVSCELKFIIGALVSLVCSSRPIIEIVD